VLFDKNRQVIISYPEGKNINSYTIPSSVTTIGRGAFYNCDNLVYITIPSSVTTIDAYAFSYCDNIISITIPSSVKTIGDNAFDNCRNLSNVTISRRTQLGTDVFPNIRPISFIYRD